MQDVNFRNSIWRGGSFLHAQLIQFLDKSPCLKVQNLIFTREYTQCTAGYTFCFVVGGVGGGVGVGVGVGVVATFNQTWHYFSRQLTKHY
jgi:hypothetical protein